MDKKKNINSDNVFTSCLRCGMILINSKREFCSKCIKKLDFIFLKAKSFLRSNPGATVDQIAQHVNTTVETIKYFIDSGRFARSGIRRIAHECKLCHKIIYEGVMCSNCEQALKDQVALLNQVTHQNEPDNKKD